MDEELRCNSHGEEIFGVFATPILVDIVHVICILYSMRT